VEIAVVGAGPAGSFCALRLARAGHRVTLFDASHPREKPCGGGLTPGAFARHPELARLRPLGRPAAHVTLRGPAGEEVRVALPSPIVVFARQSLDGALLGTALDAGAGLRRERVRDVAVRPAGVDLATDRSSGGFDFVVGADGAASVVRRRLTGARPGGRASFATAGFHVHGLPERELQIEFFPDLRGYLWIFPRGDHASVGIAAPVHRANGTELRARVLEALARRHPGSLALPRVPFAAAIPCATPRRARRPALGGPRFALVGDAADQNDAITGEGIAHALDSAALVAESLHEHGPLDAARAYAGRWMRGPGRELALAARWAARFVRPASVAWFLRLARDRAWARSVMADCLACEQPYSTLGRRALREAVRAAAG
jgi:flavin-dependent dehydrogenase